MFLIHRKKDICRNTLHKLISQLEGIPCGPIQQICIDNYWLSWSRCKPDENLHLFDDGIFLGKLSYKEESNTSVIKHVGLMPSEFHPLTFGLCIRNNDSTISIEPLNVTNIYYGNDAVSDMQLLIADAEGHVPYPEGVGILATVGFFPGNLTLFSEIKKIPLLASYNLSSHQLSNIPAIKFQKPDDLMLIERLKNIVPDHPLQYLALSAGYDSRFILGLLHQKGVNLRLINISGDETGLVLNIAEQLDYPCDTFEATESSYLSPKVYTLASDAQIYFRGGNYSCLRNTIVNESLFHIGHFSPPINKNAYASVITTPGTNMSNIYQRLIDHLFVRPKESMVYGLQDIESLQYLNRYLYHELDFGNDYCSSKTTKEWANWFDYIHFELRWGYANIADLSFFTYVVFLLSDLEALKMAISSDRWANFKYDRARKINAELLPEITVHYHNGGKFSVQDGLRNNISKIKFEYIDRLKNPGRFITYLFKPNKISPPQKKIVFSFEGIDIFSKEFTKYFIEDFPAIIENPIYSYWLKRAAVTVGYALQFLGK